MHNMRRGFFKLALVFVFCLTAAPTFRAADPLPAQLSDDAYWKMITDFSEDGGYFRFENFLSNAICHSCSERDHKAGRRLHGCRTRAELHVHRGS
jgi:hypothetical protein